MYRPVPCICDGQFLRKCLAFHCYGRHLKTKYLLKQGEVKALYETLAVVNVYMVMDTLSDTLAKAEIETLNERKARRIRP